ncbi:6-phosphogluconolactonase [Actibacterium sp. XHP0104]|uniref:6-phosphogluconolactonase n=1 Tax=Actibacterium sp. XHP0104 TaxID=2984335 RepID=UPI0021E863A3|nr:6-phosphogluconolactonase [Actibacterium sp. XHP0104]MCV2881183.1 6-phosphogluconolactonase [Actibacterium sp. XHP0104]
MKLIEYTDREAMMMDLANVLAGELANALRLSPRASIAVPGGTTPGPVFEVLSGLTLDWDRVDVMLTDERWVPETSGRSNTALLRRTLLRDRAAAANLIPLYADDQTPEDALPALTAGVDAALPLSVLLLGMGEDMHTASLFPGADLLHDALSDQAPALLPMRAAEAQEPRMTLTAPVLRGALSCHVVITGATKRAALDRAMSLENPLQAPICAVLKDATVHWAL